MLADLSMWITHHLIRSAREATRVTTAVLIVFVALLVTSCAHDVGQHAHTGPDGSEKTPRRVQLVDGKAALRGIVTYPGGDRVDWIRIELPAKQNGRLDIRLTWSSPRPGLQLCLDVFDAYFSPLRGHYSCPTVKRGDARKETIQGATGAIYIRVSARRRGDAGAYRLRIEFEEANRFAPDHDLLVDIPDPPLLPPVPPMSELRCADGTRFEPGVPPCPCPRHPPPNWPGCPQVCPDPPDPEMLACWRNPRTRPPCPKPWDARFAQWCSPPPCEGREAPDGPSCPPRVRIAHLLPDHTVFGDHSTMLAVPVGSDHRIDQRWRVQVLRARTDQPLDGGDAKILTLGPNLTRLEVKLTRAELELNFRVRFTPP